MPPYPKLFRNAFGSFLAMVLMVGFAFNFFGFVKIENGIGVWAFFLLATFAGLTFFSQTGILVNRVYGIIDDWENYNA